MNDLILRDDFQKSCPTVVEGLKRAQSIFDSIKSFEDIESIFLKGAGLAVNTYKSYLQSIKQLYKFTGGLNPLQVTPAHIECFYDDLIKVEKVGRNTACLRIAGLKKFFKGIRGVIPIYTSPFELMGEKLLKKLGKTKKGNRTKAALKKGELTNILDWLEQDSSIKGLENHALFFMLATSGLRASELLQLKWKDLSFDPESQSWICYFTGKGGTQAEQELYPRAVGATLNYFTQAFAREPKGEDHLFWTCEVYNGDTPRPLKYRCLWERFKEIGEKITGERIITRSVTITPHTLRRTYATLLYKSGMKLKAVQEKTRHASIETLTKHYIDDSEAASPFFDKVFA